MTVCNERGGAAARRHARSARRPVADLPVERPAPRRPGGRGGSRRTSSPSPATGCSSSTGARCSHDGRRPRRGDHAARPYGRGVPRPRARRGAHAVRRAARAAARVRQPPAHAVRAAPARPLRGGRRTTSRHARPRSPTRRRSRRPAVPDPYLRRSSRRRPPSRRRRASTWRSPTRSWVPGRVTDPLDVTTVLGNLVENALEAARLGAPAPGAGRGRAARRRRRPARHGRRLGGGRAGRAAGGDLPRRRVHPRGRRPDGRAVSGWHSPGTAARARGGDVTLADPGDGRRRGAVFVGPAPGGAAVDRRAGRRRRLPGGAGPRRVRRPRARLPGGGPGPYGRARRGPRAAELPTWCSSTSTCPTSRAWPCCPTSPRDVIMATAATDARRRSGPRCPRGALHYLIKPFTADELGIRLRRLRALPRAAGRRAAELTQDDVDRAVRALHDVPHGAPRWSRDSPRSPRGSSPTRCGEPDEPRSAAEISDEVGISRATAQRYLASLAQAGRVARDAAVRHHRAGPSTSTPGARSRRDHSPRDAVSPAKGLGGTCHGWRGTISSPPITPGSPVLARRSSPEKCGAAGGDLAAHGAFSFRPPVAPAAWWISPRNPRWPGCSCSAC